MSRKSKSFKPPKIRKERAFRLNSQPALSSKFFFEVVVAFRADTAVGHVRAMSPLARDSI